MGLFFWRNAKDRVRDASVEAKRTERMLDDSALVMRDVEVHLARILNEIPPGADPDAFRRLDLQMQVTRRHAERVREHLTKLNEHIATLDERLKSHHDRLQERKAA